MDNLVSKKDPNYSPVWVPDNSAAECMLCKKTKFTQLTRRVCNYGITNFLLTDILLASY